MNHAIPGRRKALFVAVMLAGTPLSVIAQQDTDTPEIEEVIVTGSLIRGTPLDAALPVEVYTAEDMELSGAPTALEFAKSLSVSGATTGESYYFGGAGNTGSVSYNLRGIGADKTLTLFNGRRVTENTSVIPSAAIARVEILKDGAAVTYGADATGGVVNFITRDAFEGIEISGAYKAIDGSDGDYNGSILGGFSTDNTDVLMTAQWEHRSRLDAVDRSFTDLPYSVNPAPWSTLTNLAGWLPRGALPAVPNNTANGEWGNPVAGIVSDYTQSSCEAVGGTYVNSFTCAYNYIPYYNVVSDNDIYRLYGQVNTELSENLNFYLRAAYSLVDTPYQYGSPSQPVIRGPARATGATYQLYVPKTNPYVADFATRTGFANSPAYAATQGFTPVTYRAFAHGGLDTFAESGKYSTPSDIRNKFTHVSTGFNGDLTDDISFDFGLTYNQSNLYSDSPDMMLARMQQALNGFGGESCNVPDLDPNRYGTQNPGMAGSAGCSWYNPFASNFASQPVLGLTNPSYVPGAENSDELIRWMFNDRKNESVNWNATVDIVFSGETPLQLPGGAIGWGAGAQWRKTENRESIDDPLYNGSQPCQWPNDSGQLPLDPADPRYTGCTPDRPGPFQFFGTNVPDNTFQDQSSFFGELSLPVLDSLYLSAAVRYEEFTGGLDATVYKVSGKWDATENLAFRGSYGTNYQAPGAGIIPGEVNNGVNSYTRAGGNWRGAQTVTNSGIEPETADVWGAGVIWQSEGFTDGSRFRLIVDYFNIETEKELGLLASANDIANAVFSIPATPGGSVSNNGTALADCSHPLAPRVTFDGGGCVQGVSTANTFSSIRTDFGNGPGQLTAGYDIQSTYSFPVYRGDFSVGITATKIQKFEFTALSLDGFQLRAGEDRLGVLNFATIANAASEWRGSMTANYTQGDHNFRLVMNYVSGVNDERFFNETTGELLGAASLTPAGLQPGTTTPFGPSYFGIKGEDWVSTDFHYTVDLPWATLTASIVNIEDRDPPESRQEMGYDPRIGNPLGRTFELGLRKTF
ncbi:MAG: TonB-dependent receptor [Gammaproteobacteria bacterium RIFCSPLOWO2_02_FULL_57_10]|nr:MAG: TonB-dependent receptor [Gammaproteobacteria bacterium RIFCSPLOWO2_02_FULL_57_10]